MRVAVILVFLLAAALLGGCHSNSYNYHYAGHGHYGVGHYEPHYSGHYGSFGHPRGQHGYSELE